MVKSEDSKEDGIGDDSGSVKANKTQDETDIIMREMRRRTHPILGEIEYIKVRMFNNPQPS